MSIEDYKKNDLDFDTSLLFVDDTSIEQKGKNYKCRCRVSSLNENKDDYHKFLSIENEKITFLKKAFIVIEILNIMSYCIIECIRCNRASIIMGKGE